MIDFTKQIGVLGDPASYLIGPVSVMLNSFVGYRHLNLKLQVECYLNKTCFPLIRFENSLYSVEVTFTDSIHVHSASLT